MRRKFYPHGRVERKKEKKSETKLVFDKRNFLQAMHKSKTKLNIETKHQNISEMNFVALEKMKIK